MTVTYTTDGGLVGVSFLSAAEGGSGGLDGGFGGGGGLPSFGRTLLAELTSSLILDEGTGGPTWSRATKAWGFNELGYLEEIASGCAFFGGARLVRNTVRTTSEDFSNAVYDKVGSISVPSANVVICANATSQQFLACKTIGSTTIAGATYLFGYRIKRIAGGTSFIQMTATSTGFGTAQHCNFSLTDGSYAATGCTATSSLVAGTTDTYDITIRLTATATAASDSCNLSFANSLADSRLPSFVGDGVKSFELLRAWSVDVTNYDASYVPEYVSVGVAAAPYFGAGSDGAKYFETDWQGAPIAAANLLGFRREASAINNLLHSRDLSNAAWSTKTNITAAKTATGLDGIANTATTLTATAADAIILQPITLASAARCASAYVKRRTGTGTISFTQDGGSTWTDITSLINGSTWSRVQITSTLANPSVGFKISTSGDAIDVDCVQNEAGAEATSPIVTTTATITRNADSLTYQTAGNIDFAVGTIFARLQSKPGTTTRAAVSAGASFFGYNATSLTQARVYDETTTITKSGLPDVSTNIVQLACCWGPAGLNITGAGLTPNNGAFDGSFGSGANIAIGAVIGGYIGPVAIYNYQMTEAEQQAITS